MNNIILFTLVVILIFRHASGDKRAADISQSSAEITNKVVNDRFGGVGFHVFYHIHNAPTWHYDQIFAKRWRELNPSFVRINDDPTWDFSYLDTIANYLEVMKDTETEMYFTSWGTQAILNYPDEMDYVKHEVDNLEYLKLTKGFDRLNYYCMANELSLDKWASMVNDLDYFKKIQTLFHEEITARKLGIKLLATDASPISNWNTIEWAAENMDEITGVYGGHHYINSYDLFDPAFYSFFLNKMKWGSDIARSKEKRFIVGEFGAKQNSNRIDSILHDACIYNNTPLENYFGIQVAEAIIAMINGGIYACNYWTFSDFPSSYRKNYINKWGLFRWEVDNFTTKPIYYCLGLLTKFFRGPSEAYEIASSDSLFRIAAIKNLEKGSFSIAIINRNELARSLDLTLPTHVENMPFRKYVYDPENVPFNYFGDLQPHEKEVVANQNLLFDTIPAFSLVVYTTDYDDKAPFPVEGLKVETRKINGRDRNVLNWEENSESDLCYYRIFRSEKPEVEISSRKQIASTIRNQYIDQTVHGLLRYYYKVVAVDQSGNSSE